MCGALNITRTWKSETEQVNIMKWRVIVKREISFNTFVYIKSCPALFFGAKLCITEMTSSHVTGTKLKVATHRSFLSNYQKV